MPSEACGRLTEFDKLLTDIDDAVIEAQMEAWRHVDPETGETRYALPLMVMMGGLVNSKHARAVSVRYGQAFQAMERELQSTPEGTMKLHAIMEPLRRLFERCGPSL